MGNVQTSYRSINYPSGSKWIGMTNKYDAPHGYGCYYLNYDYKYFEGELYLNSNKLAIGTIYYKNGDIYEGQIYFGDCIISPKGQGTMFLNNGNNYTGNFKYKKGQDTSYNCYSGEYGMGSINSGPVERISRNCPSLWTTLP